MSDDASQSGEEYADTVVPADRELEGQIREARDGSNVQRDQARSRLKAKLFGAPAQPVRIGRFVVLDRLGQGGMGIVYAAYDPQLDRRVALKLLHTGRSESRPSGRERLLREAQALARLSHPNVVPVYDVGVIDDQVFVVM